MPSKKDNTGTINRMGTWNIDPNFDPKDFELKLNLDEFNARRRARLEKKK